MTMPRTAGRRARFTFPRGCPSASGGVAERLRRIAGALLAGAGRLWRIRSNRRATLDLLDLDDDRLADIGLTRADVHVALFDPRTPDPTGMLDASAAERRRAGRRR
ncbi:DUF1127 domain-containing protein [Pseudoxanthobacter sp. M-2]|uniref:DUF1127 domain-containing protein n=1 Tax=Pseudoxanthobacter sp. M-2 TaxID=3078754 RepID=UPI0038FD2447